MNPLVSTLIEGSGPGLAVAGALLLALPWMERNSAARMVPVLLVMALTVRYAWWRITDTVPPPGLTADFAAGLAFLVLEMAGIAGGLLSLMSLTRTRNRSAEADANAAWLGEHTPLVDVFICTYNEDREILERTIIGALSMDYPAFRVWVLDDGGRDWLRQFAAQMGCGYLARPDNTHAKAGNINYGFKHVTGLTEPPEFISILDADFVPTEGFLKRVLALTREPDVGVVQTPQHFINPDPIQNNLDAAGAIPDEQRYFFDVLMPSKDAWGTAFCCGTSSVLRVAALQEIGGMPTDSVTEDYLLTLRMKRNGYRTVYLNERLSLGLAPEGLREYVTQRARWCLGFMQIIRSKDGPFMPGNGLDLISRLSLIEAMLFWTASHAVRIAFFIVPALYLVFDIRAVQVDVVGAVSHFVPYFVAQVAVMAWLTDRRVLPVIGDLTQLLAAREIVQAAAVGLLFPKNRKFHVTAKGGDRSKKFIQWRMMRMFIALACLNVVGVALAFTFDPQRSWQDSAAVALYWSWYNMAILVAALFVCVERPRYRGEERLASRDAVWLGVGDDWQNYDTRDISVSGMRLVGSPPAAVGTPVDVQVGGQQVPGRIARVLKDEFAIAIENTLAARTTMIRLVHSGRFDASIRRVDAGAVAQRMLARYFG